HWRQATARSVASTTTSIAAPAVRSRTLATAGLLAAHATAIAGDVAPMRGLTAGLALPARLAHQQHHHRNHRNREQPLHGVLLVPSPRRGRTDRAGETAIAPKHLWSDTRQEARIAESRAHDIKRDTASI